MLNSLLVIVVSLQCKKVNKHSSLVYVCSQTSPGLDYSVHANDGASMQPAKFDQSSSKRPASNGDKTQHTSPLKGLGFDFNNGGNNLNRLDSMAISSC